MRAATLAVILLSAGAVDAQQVAVVVDGGRDSARLGDLRLYGEVIANSHPGYGFVVSVSAVNVGRDSASLSYLCHSIVLDFIPEGTTVGTDMSVFQWRPHIYSETETGKRVESCGTNLFYVRLGPADTLRPPELRGFSAPSDPRLIGLRPGKYILRMRLAVSQSLIPVFEHADSTGRLHVYVDSTGRRYTGERLLRMTLGRATATKFPGSP